MIPGDAPGVSPEDQTPEDVVTNEPAPTALGAALLQELGTALDLTLLRLEEHTCRDAAQRLQVAAARVEGLRLALDPQGGTGAPDLDAHLELREILDGVSTTLEELDFPDRLNGAMTEIQATTLEAGRAVAAAPDAPDTTVTSGPDADRLAAFQSLAEEVQPALRGAHRDVFADATRLYANVASATTRTVRAGVDGSDASSLGELHASITELADWLTYAPLSPIRGDLRALIEAPAPESDRPAPRAIATTADLIESVRARWDKSGRPDRMACELSRIRFAIALADFRGFLSGFVASGLLSEANAVARAAASVLQEAVDALRSLHDGALRSYDEGGEVDAAVLLSDGLQAIRRSERQLTILSAESRALDAATDGASSLNDAIGKLPASLRIGRLVHPGEPAKAEDDPITVEPREWAQDAFGVFVLERLRDAARPYAEALSDALALVPDAISVLEYNLGAAGEVLDDVDANAGELRRELVVGGLDRTADRLEDAVRDLAEVRASAPLAAELVLREAAEHFWERVQAEQSLEGRARDVWATLSRGAGRAGAWAGQHGSELRGSVTALLRLGSARAVGALRRARTAVGADPVARERVDATVRVISDVDASATGLPFVYRRLFSYRPVTDSSLLVGRGPEMEALDAHLERWISGEADALLIVGSSGVGVSSLINVARERWSERVDWCGLELDDRIEDEGAWARTIASVLRLGEGLDTLEDVQAALESREDPAIPQVCAIDNLELLYRRGVLDAGLIDDTLRLMSATDSCVLWIAPLATSAWQVLSALQPGATALVRVLPLEALGRDDVEAAIMARHRRSGIPLSIESPSEPPMGVRRALSNASDEETRQGVLRTAFFDRLFELSDGYVALAILYWLRSVRLEAEEETMSIAWPQPIDFAAWDDLDSTGGFALRAFLEHGSLNLEEYQSVFGVGEEQAYAAFERLGNLLLIEAVGSPRRVGTRLRFRRIEPGARYRIRPVLVRPVERLLTARRLLY